VHAIMPCNAALVAICRQADSAASNLKLVAYEFSERLPPNGLGSFARCLGHQCHIISCEILEALGMAQLSLMFSSAVLIRLPGYFVRLLLSVRRAVEQNLVITHRAPNPTERSLSRRILQAAISLSGPENNDKEDPWDPSWPSCDSEQQQQSAEHAQARSRRRELLEEGIDELLDVLNGDIRTETITHCCWVPSGGKCCDNAADTVTKVTARIMKVCFSGRPTTPIKSRWTKVLPCMAWWALAFAVHNIGGKVPEPKLTAQQLQLPLAAIQRRHRVACFHTPTSQV
jgi:hypothetical protein